MPEQNITRNGNMFFCKGCQKYHVEFGNLLFSFNKEELKIFTDYINGINGDYFYGMKQHLSTHRKIILPTKLKGISFIMYFEELEELKMLLNFKKPSASYNVQTMNLIRCDFSPN